MHVTSSKAIEIRGGSQSTENRFLNRFFVERVRKMGFLNDVYRFFDIYRRYQISEISISRFQDFLGFLRFEFF